MNSSAFTQISFTIQELVDIYEAQDKLKGIQVFELKGYTPGSDDDKREMFTSERKDEGIVYSRSTDGSKVGFMFVDNKIDNLFFRDSTAEIRRLLPELLRLSFKLSHQEGEFAKVYTKRKTNYFVAYETIDDIAFIIVMRKTKGTRILYNPKR